MTVHLQVPRQTLLVDLTCFLVARWKMNVPYLHARLPESLKWRILGALLKLNEHPHSEKSRSAILGALGAMNAAAAYGVPGDREAVVANLLVGMVSDIEAIAYQVSTRYKALAHDADDAGDLGDKSERNQLTGR